jgi:hypothetical protein
MIILIPYICTCTSITVSHNDVKLYNNSFPSHQLKFNVQGDIIDIRSQERLYTVEIILGPARISVRHKSAKYCRVSHHLWLYYCQ